jgi:acetyl-CoA carboxylase carboxyl transferase subunit beta
MGWFNTVKSPKLKNVKKSSNNTPEGIWKKCQTCNEIMPTDRLLDNENVCPFCHHHYRINAEQRLNLIIDVDTFKEDCKDLKTTDPLEFKDKDTYKNRLKKAHEKTGKFDGTIMGLGKVNGSDVAIAVMDFTFMGGSMGVVTGEKIASTFELAVKNKCPAIVVSCSGGARMQEGILSLMQMAKTSAARKKLKENRLGYISILTDPTTGGTAASFALQGDVILVEPKALIGFAGPRVIEQSIRQTLPEGFQRSEFLLDHGFIDRIVHRHKLKDELSFFVKMFS